MGTSKKREWLRYRDFVLSPYGVIRIKSLGYIKGILEQLAQQSNPVQLQAFIEVPLEADCVDMSAFAFAEVHWLLRKPQGASYGERLLHRVRAHVRLPDIRPEAETTYI